ncbi:Cell division protein FtsQ [termite gut metagenome]|uniref:Cell division protein FtsQ n=1 Tax=termite gut metagenome TaxID=433724 RepID=A0A5J4SWJ4_9ZZZZ
MEEDRRRKIKKRIAQTGVLIFTAYIVIAVVSFTHRIENTVCCDVILVIKDSVNAGFVTKREIANILQRAKLTPKDKPMDKVNTRAIEETLSKHVLIDRVECYKTFSGKLCVEINQRIPILRIMSHNGENYYIDNKGKVMPANIKSIAHLPVVTGYVDKPFATNNLYKLGLFLYENKFWNAQIEQINILPKREIELVPRVGEHIIFLGTADRLEQKFDHLKRFYLKALNNVGWNTYSRISLEFENQIVCTKR